MSELPIQVLQMSVIPLTYFPIQMLTNPYLRFAELEPMADVMFCFFLCAFFWFAICFECVFMRKQNKQKTRTKKWQKKK